MWITRQSWSKKVKCHKNPLKTQRTVWENSSNGANSPDPKTRDQSFTTFHGISLAELSRKGTIVYSLRWLNHINYRIGRTCRRRSNWGFVSNGHQLLSITFLASFFHWPKRWFCGRFLTFSIGNTFISFTQVENFLLTKNSFFLLVWLYLFFLQMLTSFSFFIPAFKGLVRRLPFLY